MQVFDKDTFTKDDPIGEVQVPLWTIPDLFQETFAKAELGKITKRKYGMARTSRSSSSSSDEEDYVAEEEEDNEEEGEDEEEEEEEDVEGEAEESEDEQDEQDD